MGRDLAEGKDVFSVDPRASPGSFLQVSGCLLRHTVCDASLTLSLSHTLTHTHTHTHTHQVTASLLEGGFALGLQPQLTMDSGDEADAAPPPTMYVQDIWGKPPPPGMAPEDWVLVR
jgi:hypothetical protein